MWPRCGYTSHHWTRPDKRIGVLQSRIWNLRKPEKPIGTPINGLQIRYASCRAGMLGGLELWNVITGVRSWTIDGAAETGKNKVHYPCYVNPS